jgi:uncharacterized membrane protein
MFDVVNVITNYMVEVIDIFTVIVIFYGFCYAVFLICEHHVHRLFGKVVPSVSLHKIRVVLWEYLLLSLELFICADVILSVKDPTFEHLLQLSLVVVVRIIISFFLNREIMHLESREG